VRITRNLSIYLVGRSCCFYDTESNGIVGKLIGVVTNLSLFVGSVLKKKRLKRLIIVAFTVKKTRFLVGDWMGGLH
jgi:hypothetical protein